ncbi:hypothetical protein [Haloferula sp. A504]|uniref:hypothetical protein n=1 Tax=Haloferula sp. A504 TaxID=3373601 RepID=UPI0031BBE8C1|nr:hypothetical protein [Verrucomicrobiaceae bacterium E54]
MPDDSTPPPSQPRSSRPRLSELSRETTEDDLWDLDDEPAEAVEEPAVDEETPESPGSPTETIADEEPASEAPDESPATAEPAPESSAEIAPTEISVPEASAAPADTESPKPSPKPKDPATPPATKLELPGRRDLINLGIVAAVFLGLAIWWIAGLFSDIPTTRIGGDEPDLPIKGDYAEVEAATTYWREPVREGENRDVARPEVSYIPVVSVKLSGGTGALRAVFRTHTGDFVGDTITQAFENGKFVANRSDTIEFPATDGYETEGDMNGYRVGRDRWKIEIFESPGADASGSRFKSMFTIPVSPAQR